MPFEASFKPVRVPARAAKGWDAWRINVPAFLSETGKRQQLYRVTEQEALYECERLKARRDNLRAALPIPNASELLESAEVRELLAAHPGLSLRDVVQEYLAIHRNRTNSISFKELFEKYLVAKQRRSPEHLYQMRWCLKRLEMLHPILASDLSTRMLEEALSSFTPSIRNQFRRHIHAVLGWGWKRDYLLSNPAAKLEAEELGREEVEIFEPDIIEKVLRDCLENDLALLPYRVFGFFCGVRPRGELPRLEWEDLDWQAKENHLKLRAAITKKKRTRFVNVSANAFVWLNEYRRRGGKTTGKVVPFTVHELRTHHRENWSRAIGLNEQGRPQKTWIKQGMRHSYCSYWLVANGNDTDTLVIQSGHDDKNVMWENYYRATTREKAKKFWSLRPKADRKIVPFAAYIDDGRETQLGRQSPEWLPASEVRGEGVFLRFKESALQTWETSAAVRLLEREFFEAHKKWRRMRKIEPATGGFPAIRYVVIHSLAHALMRQISLECGYTAASLRERIYCRTVGQDNGPMAGLMIYTAASDSEGTLGGLVDLGRPLSMGRHLQQALEAMRVCASDPLCAEHAATGDGRGIHAACCHACLFAPETSCEKGNRYLDRTTLVETFSGKGIGFFDTLVHDAK